MKSKIWLVVVIGAVGAVLLWLWTRSRSQVVRVSGGLQNTGTASPWDFLNPIRQMANMNGVRVSSTDRTLATIQAAAQAAPSIFKGAGDLLGGLGGLFRKSPTMATTGAVGAPVISTGFIGNFDYDPKNSIEAADDYFYA